MERFEVIQRLLGAFVNPSYLEIGVGTGDTFFKISAPNKVAVDPAFEFKSEMAPRGPGIEYHSVTSDEYFGSIVNPTKRFDVIFLDGLHTFEQTLRDLLNAIHYLTPQGVIVVDDVIPSSFHASLPNHKRSVALRRALNPDDPDKSWMGDVYKVVFFVDAFLQQFRFATVRENHGQLILWRHAGVRSSTVQRSMSEIVNLQFDSVKLEQQIFNVRKFEEILLLVKPHS
jgi:Methyltransferase domain